MNVISHTAHAHKLHAKIAANRCEISMHARPHVCIEPGFTVLGAEDDVNDEFAE